MRNAKHTPGPWKLTDAYTVEGQDGQAITEVYDQSANVLCEETIANAALIAAAPELLEALEIIFEQGHIWLDQKEKKTGKTFYYIVEQALNKAKG